MSINDTFKAMADPTRREILRLLKDSDMTAGELAEHFELSRGRRVPTGLDVPQCYHAGAVTLDFTLPLT